MTPRDIAGRPAEPLSLPIFSRLAPGAAARRCSRHGSRRRTAPDDVVVDLFGRGGWVARAALALGRRAVSIETSPAHPPARRRRGAGAGPAPPRRRVPGRGRRAPRHDEPAGLDRRALRDPLPDLRPQRSPLEELIWEPRRDGRRLRPTRRVVPLPGLPRPARPGRRAADGRRPAGGRRPRAGRVARRGRPGDARRASPAVSRCADEPGGLAGATLLGLHSPRQLAALHAILARIEGELRASQVTSALRLAFLHADPPVEPPQRLAAAAPARCGSPRAASSRR